MIILMWYVNNREGENLEWTLEHVPNRSINVAYVKKIREHEYEWGSTGVGFNFLILYKIDKFVNVGVEKSFEIAQSKIINLFQDVGAFKILSEKQSWLR